MSENSQPASGSFIQFGTGPRIPAKDIRWTDDETPDEQAGVRMEMLRDFSIEIPIPLETAAAICRAIGIPDVADRIEVETHPDLIELDARMGWRP